MTPNPLSPQFLRHEVPENACDNSKKLSEYYFLLREEIIKNRWNGISVEDITLTYSTYNEFTKVEVILTDCNHHRHHFIMQLLPDNGFGDGTDSFELTYLFEGTFDENALSIRSFANYLSTYLEYEGLEPKLIECNKGLYFPCLVEYAYEEICQLIDITISKIKPLVWFYTKESIIKTFNEICYYLAGIKSRLQLECCKGRWKKVYPKCFKFEVYKNEEEATLQLTYIVEDVWELTLAVDVAQCDDYFDHFCTFSCYLNESLTDGIRQQLDALFGDFLSTLKLKSAKNNTYVGAGERKDYSISIQYFHIEDTFDLFCKMLDEIVPALQNFNFQLPLQPINLTGEIGTIKEQMEAAFNTTFEVLTEEEQINKKLKCGYFQH